MTNTTHLTTTSVSPLKILKLNPLKRNWNARYTFYAMANHCTADQMFRREPDLSRFHAWIATAKRKFARQHPEHMIGCIVTGQMAFTKWIGEEVKKYLGV